MAVAVDVMLAADCVYVVVKVGRVKRSRLGGGTC